MKNQEIINYLNKTSERLKIMTGLDSSHIEYPFWGTLENAKINIYEGKNILAQSKILYIKSLLDDLDLISFWKKDIYPNFIKKLVSDKSEDSYFGIRMEIQMASNLIKKNVRFKKSEAPDFIAFPRTGIECTSCHLDLATEHTPKDLLSKILSKIREKNNKNYCLPQLILVIDISNLLFWDGQFSFPHSLSDVDETRHQITKVLNQSIFQSVITNIRYWTVKENIVENKSGYNRYDKEKYIPFVRNLTNNIFPYHDIWEEGRIQKTV